MRSAAVAVRALIMLACVVAIPALAMSGASWQEIVKKFQNYQWPSFVNRASASSTATETEAPRFAPSCSLGGPTNAQSPEEPRQSLSVDVPPTHAADRSPPPTESGSATDAVAAIGQRLQRLGATYYILETWGNQQQLYRFHCKVAMDGKAGLLRCFEAVDADPLRAMHDVLRQVEGAGDAARQSRSM